MSGIAGFIHFDGAPVAPGMVEEMTGAMPYRGPDGINHWVKGGVALGQCMLYTTPESLEEQQPLANEDESLVLVMDGRVDNWEELRRELSARGAALRTHADGELVLRAYERWGRDCVLHVDGDFAFVLWDSRRREAFCARDRMGSRPFNYHWDGKTLSFASELHAILTLPWIEQKTNDGMLAEFLAAKWYSRTETLWCGVLRLVAAHRMVVDPGGPHIDRYWCPDLGRRTGYSKAEDYIEHYRELLLDEVRRLSRSHRPLACEVSGGLDSSAVFAIADQLRRRGRLLAPVIAGYTVPFADDERANEVDYCRAVGKHLGVTIEEVPPQRVELSWFAGRARKYRDFPGFPTPTMAIALLHQASAGGSRAILNGLGGDEWQWGSRAYFAETIADGDWLEAFRCFKTDAAAFGGRQAFRWLIKHGLFPLLPKACQAVLRDVVRVFRKHPFDDAYWLSPEMRAVLSLRREQSAAPRDDGVGRAGQHEMLETLRDAYLGLGWEMAERMYAECRLEPRRPLHTASLVQYAFSTPEMLRLHGEQMKHMHVRALQNILPKTVLERKNKAEFSVMFHEHLDRMEGMMCETLPRAHPGWLNGEGVARLFQAYRDTPTRGWPQWILWSLFGCHVFFAEGLSPLPRGLPPDECFEESST